MDRNTPQDKEDQPSQNEGSPFPKEIILKYDKEPIVKLADAISKQSSGQQQKENSGNDIGERQIQEQQRANEIFSEANRINDRSRKIAKKSMYLNVFLF